MTSVGGVNVEQKHLVAPSLKNNFVPSAGNQPDITYHPDREKWIQRTAWRLAQDPSLLSTPLPAGFPAKLQSPLVWEGKDWKNEAQWVYTLTSQHLKEIDAALHHFHGTKHDSMFNFVTVAHCSYFL